MSMSDTCIEASRDLLRYMKAAGTSTVPDRNDPIARAVVLMLIYVVQCEAAALAVTDEATQKNAILVFRQHLEDTPDWTGSVESRCDDFNVIHAVLKDPHFKPEYTTPVKH